MALTQIKICGLTREADVAVAAAKGATLFGFIHVPKSPRFVPMDALAPLLAKVPEGGKKVIVVQDASRELLDELNDRFDFDFFQFHGSETPDLVAGYSGYKVIHVKGAHWDREALDDYPGLVMFDTDFGDLRGGSGRPFNWQILQQQKRPFLVAGGLKPDNVGQLIRDIRPWGVDVSSGVERAPGVKDHDAIDRFISQVRSAEA